MTAPVLRDWQSVRAEVLRRIHARDWKPGEMIPNEADLAAEFGCARSTVNRALRDIAQSGLLDRRRKAGTRVASNPAARATLTIPVMREEIEGTGRKYGYQLLSRSTEIPPVAESAAMQLPPDGTLLHIRALHLADDRPFALENRWIDPGVVPGVADAHFERISANEWLLQNAAYTHGEIAFSATVAGPADAPLLGCAAGAPLFVTERLTWDTTRAVTRVRILFAPGYQMRTGL
ncbi:GntR family transcriptional regulator [Roseobacter ponti]|uniref:GntR family transcriptional regulator n=1 Tax=Roseobacter ponti TaxID=1891787 RepID=UPI001FE57E91|nr:GntR family transcriptional regulator [Roseobacter ponti]